MSGRFIAALRTKQWPTGLDVTVNDFEINDRGGPVSASIEASGQDNALWGLIALIGEKIIIANQHGNIVWHGQINGIAGVVAGNSIGITLKTCYNRVAVTYSAPDATGASQSYTTAWTENTDSQAVYGVREHVLSIGEANAAMALRRRDDYLAAHAWPTLTGKGWSASPSKLTISCVGLAQTLAYRKVSMPRGRIVNEPTSRTTQLIGWRRSSNGIGLSSAGVYDNGNLLSALQSGDFIVISNAVLGNGTYMVKSPSNTQLFQLTSTNVDYDAPDDIYDFNDGLTDIRTNTWIGITNSARNNGYWYIKQTSPPGRLTISTGASGGSLQDGDGGTITTITQGQTVGLNIAPVILRPGQSTVAIDVFGSRIAQRFQVTETMTAGRLALYLAKTGSPADSLRVAFYTDVAGNLGTQAVQTTISPANIYAADEPVETWIDLPSPSLAAGYHWIVVERTGSYSDTDYYRLSLSSTAYLSTLAWNGTAWAPLNYREYPATEQYSMPFRLYDVEDSSVTIQRIISTYPSPLITGLVMPATTGVLINSFLDNDQSALDELIALLDAGDSAGNRLILTCTVDGTLHVYAAAALNEGSAPVLHRDGVIHSPQGARYAAGVFPVGGYLALPGVPRAINDTWRLSPTYVASIRYNTDNDTFSYQTATDDSSLIMLTA